MTGISDFSANALSGEPVALKQFEGKVLLIVNTASACGFTPQYAGLEKLQQDFAPRGFSVLGFPCNQFGAQEPGDARQIESFCETNYHVTFPLFEKIDVNGPRAHPLYNHLKSEKSGLLGAGIKWNFTKFLVDRSGRVVERFAPTAKPESLREKIEALL
ncbi:glutathione peroxidase [Tardiphaga sp. 813_E8_N1_3]|jgi:glutathione peroxidase|uniref:glutathione peroxidase n=1 Tax=Tardiphaga sp. 813_E8_N1_3 TaxID=3240760 RepID=UPI003F1F25A1